MKNKTLVTLVITDHVNETTKQTFLVDSGFDCTVFVGELENALEKAKKGIDAKENVALYHHRRRPVEVRWFEKYRSYRITTFELNQAQEVEFNTGEELKS